MAQETENKNVTGTNANNATPVTTAATSGNVLETIQTAVATTEHQEATKENRPKRSSFVAQLLSTDVVERTGRNAAVALTFGLPDGSSRIMWTNPKMWSRFSDKFAIDSYVRVDFQTTIAGDTTYHDEESDKELIHNTSGDNFNGIGRATQGMYNAKASVNMDDIQLITGAAPESAGAIAQYLGMYRAAMIKS